jgi:predicted RNA-binding Zn-ribbon protein involved in translation (DUF1610 family)
MSGRPRFFCEHCGAEVPRNARRCASCGRHFSSVLCPKCGFSGAESQFAAGCPVCGYSAPRADCVSPDGSGNGESPPAGALPFWVYALTVLGVLSVVLAAIVLLR